MQVSTLPTNWKPTDNNAPGPVAWPEGAVGVTPNLKWSSGGTVSATIEVPNSEMLSLTSIEVGVLVEHRAPETLVVRLHHDGRSVDLPMTNDASPLNERRLTTDAFTGTDRHALDHRSRERTVQLSGTAGVVRTPDTIN